MKQSLKIAIPILALMAVVFLLAFFAQYRRSDDEKDGGEADSGGELPLRFFTSTRHWDPHPNADLQDRAFPGFYEVQANAAGKPNGAAFWFENRNDKSVTLQLKGISCTACSGGRLAPIPPDVTRQIIQMSIVSGLPGGLAPGFPIGVVGPAANLSEDRLAWQSFAYKDNPHAEYKVPAANNPDGWSPQWGILELRFSVGTLGAGKPLSAEFTAQVDGSKRAASARFDIMFEGVDPFELSRTEIDLGELKEESAKASSYDVVVYSATRGKSGTGPGDLAAPAVDVQMPPGVPGQPGEFVSVSPPVRVPDEELAAIAREIQRPTPTRVEAAYRVTVTVSPKVGDKQVDLGPLEREIHFSTADARKTLRVRGTVNGAVRLDDKRRDMALSYKFADGIADQPFVVITDYPDAELVRVPDPTTPDFLEVALEKLPPAPDRGYYRLKLTVPPKKKAGSWTGFVVLKLNGPKPQIIKIPVKGNGSL